MSWFKSARLLTQGSFILRQHQTPAICHKNFHTSRATKRLSKPAKVTLIQGDGVYPEILEEVQMVLQTLGAPVEFESFLLSDIHPESSANLDEVVESVRSNGVCLSGIIGVTDFLPGGDLDSTDYRFRKALDLFASVVTIKSHPGIQTRHENIDMVIIKEQLQGFYSALEHEAVPGVVECLNVITEPVSQRLAKLAFDYATQNDRKKVTAVHKANIMKLADGLFMRTCTDTANNYPNIDFETMIVDNCSMQIVSNPYQFDVMVMPGLYGDILINLGAGMVGGAGMTHAISHGADVIVFEPGCKHMFTTAAGKNIANPTAMLNAAADMLTHLNFSKHAQQLRDSVDKVIQEGNVKTEDIGGSNTTKEFVQEVMSNL